jgi:hypothetical protein
MNQISLVRKHTTSKLIHFEQNVTDQISWAHTPTTLPNLLEVIEQLLPQLVKSRSKWSIVSVQA